jgi:hydrogenase nickel incorporation protein HypB
MKHIPIVENVLKLNDEVAGQNRKMLGDHGVFCIDLIGAPGSGKTALLEATLRELSSVMTVGVIVGDLTTTRDAERLGRFSDHVVQINTGRGCHLEAHQVQQAFGQLNLPDLDLLIIENVGNLICPVGFDLGQNLKVGMFSVSEGDDKPAKHPYLVHAASLVLLNKMDLLPFMDFDMSVFEGDVTRLNADAELLRISVKDKDLNGWLDWLQGKVDSGKTNSTQTEGTPQS